ncbi:hypothetical protein HYW21_02215 [Candidatus Woesearchaeota archaeon]|nr:hypothetical protein [Candidatus Woesearchaeota archaeon]
MHPEKEIMNWWLHRQGFFTINSIKAGKNRTVDILAIKLQDKKVEHIQHIELSCSVSSSVLASEEYLNKFTSRAVVKTVNACIKEHLGEVYEYTRVLVIGVNEVPQELPGIQILRFENVLYDVFTTLDKQNYQSPVIRTLQLLKYVFLGNAEKLAQLISTDKDEKLLTQNSRAQLLSLLLTNAEIQRIVSKPSFEEKLLPIFQTSPLGKPETLVRFVRDVLPQRSQKKFMSLITEDKGEARKGQSESPKQRNERRLQEFY